jgi:hypothetical protein
MRCAVLIVAIMLSYGAAGGCSSKPGGGDGGSGGGGGGNGVMDLSAGGTQDLSPRPIAGIACGANTCTTGLELCCTSDNGATGVCQPQQNPSCGGSEFLCDGPEDCEPANPECCVFGGIAACRPSGYCASMSAQNARFMCHVTADCVSPAQCHNAPSSPYALCF